MKVRRVSVSNFRGVRSGSVLLDTRSLLVGGNAVGKSTVCEALDLVLGLERLYRRPVIDEYDFHQALYRGGEPGGTDSPPEVRIEVVLTDLSAEAQRRFAGHVRPWSAEMNDFAPPADIADAGSGVTAAADDAGGEDADLAAGEWCLPVVFLGRFNPDEDDFEGSTFFAHPQRAEGDYEPEELGGGLAPFRREDKRYCGYLYLRPNRTGSRALSFGRGSLIDTIVRLESDQAGSLWTSALDQLDGIDLAESTPGFGKIRAEMLARVRKFLAVPDDDTAIGVRPSDLTREHLREVLRMFIAARPGVYPVPFSRLSTGALNVLVFALLTYIADLRGPGSVIFAMEEPEIALPPHTQRRMVDFVAKTMGQAIVTSHSPYVIERFAPEEIVVLNRDDTGTLSSSTIALGGHVKSRKYRAQRRQFAEAILANARPRRRGRHRGRRLPCRGRRAGCRRDARLRAPGRGRPDGVRRGQRLGRPQVRAGLRRHGQARVRHARHDEDPVHRRPEEAGGVVHDPPRDPLPRHGGPPGHRGQPCRAPQVPLRVASRDDYPQRGRQARRRRGRRASRRRWRRMS